MLFTCYNVLYFILDVWNQYDGVLNKFPEKGGLFQKVQFFIGLDDYEKKLERDLKLTIKVFFPKWKHFQTDGEEVSPADVFNSLRTLYKGLKKNYFKTCKQWRTETDFIQAVGKVSMYSMHGNFSPVLLSS